MQLRTTYDFRPEADMRLAGGTSSKEANSPNLLLADPLPDQ
jgi:hypothetical protein